MIGSASESAKEPEDTAREGRLPSEGVQRSHGRRQWLVVIVFLLAWAHGMMWASIVPPWQAPDEPLHYEYACLLAEQGIAASRPYAAIPAETRDKLQERIIRSLADHSFWEYLGWPTPDPLPSTFDAAEDPWLGRAGTQVSDESPLYYLVPALICRWLPGVEWQLFAMRAYSAALSAGVVVLGFLAARELWLTDVAASWAVATWLSFQPMAAFVGASVNNDALANLGGAVMALLIVRGCRRGWSMRRVLLLLLLAIMLPLSKKSGLFAVVLVAAILGCIGYQRVSHGRTLRAAGRRTAESGNQSTARVTRRSLLLAVPVGILLAGTIIALWPVHGQATGWGRRGTVRYDARSEVAAHSGTWSLVLPASTAGKSAWLVQTVPSNRVQALRGEEVVLQLWLRSGEYESGMSASHAEAILTLDDGVSEAVAVVATTSSWQFVELRHRVTTSADRLRVLLAAQRDGDSGPDLFFDDVSLRSGENQLLRNGSAEDPKRRWEGWMAGYLRLPLWFGQELFAPASYSPAALERYAFYVAVTFANFWGDFGWLTLPLPLWLYTVVALVTVGAVIGCCWARLQSPWRWQRRAMIWLGLQAGLVLLIALIPMIGRAWQPQGRYLFAALVPWAIFFVCGWKEWGSRLRWPHWWTVPVLGIILLDMVALQGVVIPHYYGGTSF